MPAIVTRAAMEARRMQAIELLRQGMSQAEVARKFDVSKAAVSDWHKKWKEQGKRSLRGKPHSGRPTKLDEDQRGQLTDCLDQGALACGFETDDWTCPRVQRLIAQRFAVDYHVDHLSRLLRELGVRGSTPQKTQ